MLKKRVVASLIIRDGIAVQSLNFRRYLPIGDPAIAVEFLNQWGIDEIVVLDISASRNHARKNYDFIKELAHACFVPLAVGGGISSIEDIHTLLSLGADKIIVNSICLDTPGFITKAAEIFGSQCVTASIDVVGADPSSYRVYRAASGVCTEIDPVAWACEVESLGAGEIFLTSVDRDGSKRGFDIPLIETIAGVVEIPVVASGGAGNAEHICEVFLRTAVSGAAAANFFHFSEHSVITTKAILAKHGLGVRFDTQANYSNSVFGVDHRITKHTDEHLESLLYERMKREIL